MKIGNHILYFEATTMKELAKQMQDWYDNRTDDDKESYCINWSNIQKEDNKFTCIASIAVIRVMINTANTLPVKIDESVTLFARLTEGEYMINSNNPLPVKVDSGYSNPVLVKVTH